MKLARKGALVNLIFCMAPLCVHFLPAGLSHLASAERAELVQAGVNEPTTSSIRKAILKEELASHCKRRTQGCSETTEQIEALLLAMHANKNCHVQYLANRYGLICDKLCKGLLVAALLSYTSFMEH